MNKRSKLSHVISIKCLLQACWTAVVLLAYPLSSTAVAANPAAERFEQAYQLKPQMNNGKLLYNYCLSCHGPEGWGTVNGGYPQIAGQLSTVTIKQLQDINSRSRSHPFMAPYTSIEVLATAQDVADLAGYIANMPMSPDNGRGNERDLELGQELFKENCTRCHGNEGEGNLQHRVPRIQGQHYNYLMRQLSWIRSGQRHDAVDEMSKILQKLSLREQSAIMSYVAYLKPPARDLAKPGWINPDFPNYDRTRFKQPFFR